MTTRPGVKPDASVADLVQRWLTFDTERYALRKNGPALRGYQWKNVFLPEGSCLRTKYRHANDFAKGIGDLIVAYDGRQLTPSQFANLHATGRNAWRFVWVRFPGNDFWSRAADCRTRLKEQLQKPSTS